MSTSAVAFRWIAVAALATSVLAGPGGVQPAGAIMAVWRVAPGGASMGACGDTWANACDLQYALTSLAGVGSEVWVAAGTYLPGATESDSFIIPEGVGVYGGFDGVDDEWADRDWAVNATALSGELGGGSHSTHVVQMIGPVTNLTVLDGFTISGGAADGVEPADRGGGLYCDGSGSGNYCNPKLEHLIFQNNLATFYGGAIYLDGSDEGEASPVIQFSSFISNVADWGDGGAIYCEGRQYGTCSPHVGHSDFSGNTADHRGGAMFNHADAGEASPVLGELTFTGNSATGGGGAIFNQASNEGESSPVLVDVSFVGNTTLGDGGAIHNIADGWAALSSPRLSLVTIAQSEAVNGAGMYSKAASGGASLADLTDVIFTGNTATQDGGGVYFEVTGANSSLAASLSNVDFDTNAAGQSGGGMLLRANGEEILLTMTDGTFEGNTATVSGGAIAAHSLVGSAGNIDMTVSNTYFLENHADVSGGALYQLTSGPDGDGPGSTISLQNSVLARNNSDEGGAIHMYTQLVGGGDPDPVWEDPKGFLNVTNVSMSNNAALAGAGAISAFADTGSIAGVNVHNSILWGDDGVVEPDEIGLAGASDANISYSDIAGGCPAGADCSDGGMLDADPIYVDAASHDLRVQANSPVIDAADNNRVSSEITTDIAGKARLIDHPGAPDTGAGAAPIVDMGAYEYQFACPPNPMIYVDVDATGNEDGTSWEDAFTSIPVALGTYEYCAATEEMWVAEGVYLAGTHREDTNSIAAGTKMYGGFEGTETLRSQRDPLAHPTILTGDIGGDDTVIDGVVMEAADIQGDNLYHVVYMYGDPPITPTNTVLDGFTITGGQANGALYPDDSGGGLYCFGRSDAMCNPTLANLVFSGNFAFSMGGALMNAGSRGQSSPVVTNVTFMGNAAGDPADATYSGDGGAVYNEGYGEDLGSGPEPGLSSPTFTNVTFAGNQAEMSGGAVYNDGSYGGISSPVLTNVTFHQNSAGLYGGAIINQAAYEGTNLTRITNATFSGNSASAGGGQIATDGYSGGTANVTVTNSILWGGSASYGNEANTQNGTTTFSYSVIANAYDEYNEWDALLGTDGGGNTGEDPMLGTLSDNGGFTQTIALLAGSAAIDSGDDAACAGVPVDGRDQRGYARPHGSGCDIGAFERLVPNSEFDLDYKTEPAKFIGSSGDFWWLEPESDFWTGIGLGADAASYVPRSDFDGDGITDPTKYISSGALWHVHFGPLGSATWIGTYIGNDGTVLAGSDFDGDNLTDPAKFVAGAIWYIESSTGMWKGIYVGADADPVLTGSDFDGDDKADPAKYAAGGIWYLASGSGTWQSIYIGADGTPVYGSDFDGDGRTDAAKFTAGNVLWYVPSGGGGLTGVSMGGTPLTYVPAADFDGDGFTDPAGFDPVAHLIWYLPSGGGGWQTIDMQAGTYIIVN